MARTPKANDRLHQNGCAIAKEGTETTGDFVELYALTSCTVESITVRPGAELKGTASDLVFPAGANIQIPFTSVKLSAGTAICYFRG